MNFQKSIFAVLLILYGQVSLYSQDVITASIFFAKNDNVSVCWAIGELVSETIAGNSIILSQGFYQSNLNVTSLDKIIKPGMEISVFPNPVTDLLIIECSNPGKRLSYRLVIISGGLICEGYIIEKRSEISFNLIPSGLYLLIIKVNDQIIETFKIEKL